MTDHEPMEPAPPGHPTSADPYTTAGEVLSGRGQGAGGSLDPEVEVEVDESPPRLS